MAEVAFDHAGQVDHSARGAFPSLFLTQLGPACFPACSCTMSAQSAEPSSCSVQMCMGLLLTPHPAPPLPSGGGNYPDPNKDGKLSHNEAMGPDHNPVRDGEYCSCACHSFSATSVRQYIGGGRASLLRPLEG
jgi:hypothetical protein